MAEDVKITVIATGFRQGSAERREQLLAAALRQEVIAPRIESRPATPRFASEEQDEEFVATAAPPQPNTLIPISAREFVSAFRVDDFASQEPEISTAAEENGTLAAVAIAEVPEQPTEYTPTHPAFIEEPSENLDIPAFLRKGTL